MDNISLQRIEKLHPKLRDEAKLILADIDKVLTGRAKCRIAFGLRSFAEQQAIYDQGRTTKGAIVTNAKPGQSYHNFGLAVDIVLIIDNKEASWDINKDWDNDKTSDWLEVVGVFKKYGWEWGGNWTSLKDYPHFQKTFGYDWRGLLDLHNKAKLDKDGYVLI